MSNPDQKRGTQAARDKLHELCHLQCQTHAVLTVLVYAAGYPEYFPTMDLDDLAGAAQVLHGKAMTLQCEAAEELDAGGVA